MRAAIHQPEFMPWMGFFYKMASADVYVVFDHVQFKKRYFENRNRIVSSSGKVDYIGVPVKTKGNFGQSIAEVEIDNTQRWKNKLLVKLSHFYSKAPFFEKYYQMLGGVLLKREYRYLKALNLTLIDFFKRELKIATPCELSSTLDVARYKGSDLILKICLEKKANEYLCGSSGRDYLKPEDFKRHQIEIRWLEYSAPVYRQLCPKFVPHLSTLDLLFNHGHKSREILMNVS